MDIDQYKKFLLSSIPTASLAGGGKVINCRCFLCPDSKNPKNKHFYISIPQSDKDLSLYYCHKCHNSGIMSYKKMIEWGIYDDDMAVQLIKHNSNAMKYGGNYDKYANNIHYSVQCRTTTNSDVSLAKLNYFNERIGTNFNYDDLRKLKVILNLYDILNDNGIKNLTRDPRIIEQLNYNFLGFLSIDNAFLNMRRVCDEGLVQKSIDKRYINYKLFDKFDTSERFYTIPASVNLLSTERIKIHVAEGPFDILSIYENLRNRENGIYTSIGGSNYLGMAMYFLEMYKLSYVEFHYYPDNDKFGSNENMKIISNFLKPLRIPMFVHRNIMSGEKDFGVPLNRIQESIIPM